MKNAMSVDLEDWFCANSFSGVIDKKDWAGCESRIVKGTTRILNLLDRHNTKATFFVLGWIAERFAEVVREIEARNHEIAVHGYNHLLITKVTPAEFEEDLNKSIEALRKCGVRQNIIGFRAPSFTIVESTKWALAILEKYGFKYDSSVFPVRLFPDYGIADAPLAPYRISENMYEFPLSCVELMGRRWPCSGGAYFRLLPYYLTRYFVRRCNREKRPFICYIHPWELDPEHPRISISRTRRFGHYYGLGRTEKKLDLLLSEFQFVTVREVIGV